MSCPFCGTSTFSHSVYPIFNFNNKFFNYVKCRNCDLIYLNNFPDAADYTAMYPPSYQGDEVVTTIQSDPYKKLPGLRFSYGYQYDLVRKLENKNPRILDYGCGNGHFIANAIHSGFQCDGAEFSSEYVKLLQSAIPNAQFYTIGQLLAGEVVVKYDVIRLSNVLEHLTEPLAVLNKLKDNLHPGGIILVEGPVEENFCLASAFRKIYFRLRKLIGGNRPVSSPPYHIFFSNRKNQRDFFKKAGLTETHFEISEDAWPFPATISGARGIKQKIMAVIAKTSISLSKLFNKNWGNTFIYSGRAGCFPGNK